METMPTFTIIQRLVNHQMHKVNRITLERLRIQPSDLMGREVSQVDKAHQVSEHHRHIIQERIQAALQAVLDHRHLVSVHQQLDTQAHREVDLVSAHQRSVHQCSEQAMFHRLDSLDHHLIQQVSLSL